MERAADDADHGAELDPHLQRQARVLGRVAGPAAVRGVEPGQPVRLHDDQRTEQRVLRRWRHAPRRPPPHRRRLRRPLHRQHRHRRHQHLRPRHQHVDPGGEHAPAALVPVAHRAGRRPLRRAQRQHHRRHALGRDARGLRPGHQHVVAAHRRVDVPDPRGGVPVLLPAAERQGPGHGTRRGRHLRPRRRQQDVDAGGARAA